MIRKTIWLTMAGGMLVFGHATAQVAAKKGIELQQIINHIDSLAAKNDAVSRKKLQKEAETLALNKKDEKFVLLGVKLYDFLGETEKAQQVKKIIEKRFPSGELARAKRLKYITSDLNRSASVVQKEYEDWLKKFPAEAFPQDRGEIYIEAAIKVAYIFFKEGDIEKGKAYVESVRQYPLFPLKASSFVTKNVQNQDYANVYPLLDIAYEQAMKNIEGASTPSNNAAATRILYDLSPAYAEALLAQGKSDKALTVMEQFVKRARGAKGIARNVSILAQTYEAQGRELDAFLNLETFLLNVELDKDLIRQIEPIYNKLNSQKGDFQTYISGVEKQFNELLISTYKNKMISKKAPDFSLVDKDGSTVSLSDLKGKIVVLDFWATWCVPCKESFPGMQATINKYKSDEDVVFLFVDAFQKEKNYRELVNDFITKSDYTFRVLFDVMDDKSKAAVTAYGVHSIPHKVIIDKEGIIRFEMSGSGDSIQEIVSEMSAKIELARSRS